jgi:hypothetical protein
MTRSVDRRLKTAIRKTENWNEIGTDKQSESDEAQRETYVLVLLLSKITKLKRIDNANYVRADAT